MPPWSWADYTFAATLLIFAHILNDHSWWAEHTLSMRAFLHNKEWLWVEDVLCLRKDEEVHSRPVKAMFAKICTCGGTCRNCALGNIKTLHTDFEIGLCRAFLSELHKHQQD